MHTENAEVNLSAESSLGIEIGKMKETYMNTLANLKSLTYGEEDSPKDLSSQ
jgi:hypothetical protein